MGTDASPTPEASLHALALGEAPVLERLAQMQVGTLEHSNLDEETYVLVRLAALVAVDAEPVSYRAHLGVAGTYRISMEATLGTLMAIAPLVGSARVLSAASKLVRAGLVGADLDEPVPDNP
jgi:hypothetical protein